MGPAGRCRVCRRSCRHRRSRHIRAATLAFPCGDEFEQGGRSQPAVAAIPRLMRGNDVGGRGRPARHTRPAPGQRRHSRRKCRSHRYCSVATGMIGSSIAIDQLLSRIERIGNRSRTAVSKSMPGEADRGISPDIDAQLIRSGQLRAHRQPQAISELRGLAPADIAERRYAISRTASAGRAGDPASWVMIVFGHIDGVLKIPQHAIGAERRVVAFEQRQPFGQPASFDCRDFRCDRRRTAAGSSIRARQASISIARVSFASPTSASMQGTPLLRSAGSSVAWTIWHVLWHRDAECGLGEAAPDPEDQVGPIQEMRATGREWPRRRNRAQADAFRRTRSCPPALVETGAASSSASVRSSS